MPFSRLLSAPRTRALLLFLVLGCAVLVGLYALRLDAVLGAVLDLDARDIAWKRAAALGFVAYGAALVSLALLAVHLLLQGAREMLRRSAPRPGDPAGGEHRAGDGGEEGGTLGWATVPVVLAATAVPVLAFVDTTVFKDYGIHVYEYDVASVFRDATSARDLGIRPQDVVFATGVGTVLVVAQLALFAVLGRLARRLPAGVGPAAAGLLVLVMVGGGALYGVAGGAVLDDRHEFLAVLPLRHALLLDTSSRPWVPVRPRVGEGGYPVLDGAERRVLPDVAEAPPLRSAGLTRGGEPRLQGASPARPLRPRSPAVEASSGGAAAAASPGVPVIEDRRNIVVFLGDGFRADHVGEDVGLTPELMAFGRRPEVLVPERHYSTSHATETGLYGLVYGLEAFTYHAFLEHRVPPWPLEVLKANGYVTALLAGTRVIQYPSSQLLDAFDEVIYPSDDDELVSELERFVQARREDGRPYLVVAFFYTPHYPYDSVKPVNRVHLPAIEEESRSPFQSFDHPDFRLRARNAYRNAVMQADDYFAAVLELVRDDYETGRTALVATSDHGTEMWEHGLFGHGRSTFWEEKVRVPMYMGLPGMRLENGAVKEPPLASHPDLWPTLLEWLGARPLPESEAWSHGVSLLSTPAEALAVRDDVVLAGRYFPWANRMNTLVGSRGKHWFSVRGVADDGSFRVDVSRTTDLDDRPLTAGTRPDPAPLLDAFVRDFWRFLEPAGELDGGGR